MKSKLFKMLPVIAAMLLVSAPAFAQDGGGDGGHGLMGLGIGLAMGLSVLGSGLAQGRLGGSAMESMARNPQVAGDIRTSMLIGMAFPESLVLFSFAIAFLLLGKIA